MKHKNRMRQYFDKQESDDSTFNKFSTVPVTSDLVDNEIESGFGGCVFDNSDFGDNTFEKYRSAD